MAPMIYHVQATLMLFILMTGCLAQDCNVSDVLDKLGLLKGSYQGVQPEPDAAINAQVVTLSDTIKIEFQASDVFPSECRGFPMDFCFRVNFKLRYPVQRPSYLFTLTNQRYSVELGVSLRSQEVVLEYKSPGNSRTQSASFQVDTNQLANGDWHRLQICVVGQQAKLNMNCSVPAQSKPLKQRAEVDVTGYGLVGRKAVKGGKKRQSIFQGSIAELQVLLYSSNVEESFCRAITSPSTVTTTPTATSSRYEDSGNTGGYDRMPVRIAEKSQVCDLTGKGTFWYDTSDSSMKLCDGRAWTCFGNCQCKMDYLEYNQTLSTTNASDTEFFEIPGKGLFICITQNPDTKGGADDSSIIFHLSKGIWSEYQRLETKGAQDCEFFTVDGDHYIAVANFGNENSNKVVDSVVFRWNNNNARFNLFASLTAGKAKDSTFFCIAPTQCFLAVAKYSDGVNIKSTSVIYKFSQGTFQLHQDIPTQGGYDMRYFKVGNKHFLAVANAFDGETTNVNSFIYKWDEKSSMFQKHQGVPTIAATDWEFFQVKDDSYLVVANSYNHTPDSLLDERKHEVDSVIYKYDKQSGYFVVFQSVTTYSASKWLYFEVCGDSYLAVANSYDDNSQHNVHSKIYRYQGVEKFVQVHSIETSGAVDWDHIQFGGQDFLSCANSRGENSHILVVKKL